MPPWKYPSLLTRMLLPGAVFFADPAGGRIYLTFDDGPDSEVTPALLDILARYQARATFFVSVSIADWWLDLLRQIAAPGHVIASHGLQHESSYFLSNSHLLEQLTTATRLIKVSGVKVAAAFRPPFGQIRPDTVLFLKQRGIKTILWSKIPGDYREMDLELLFQRATKGLHPGDVLVLHDGTKLRPAPVLDLTQRLLEYIYKQGWRCSALDLPYLGAEVP